MKTATFPFEIAFMVNEKTKKDEVLRTLKELHSKYRRFYNGLKFDPPYAENPLEWKFNKEKDATMTALPFLKSQILIIELTLWDLINILQTPDTDKHKLNAVRFLNLIKKDPCNCPAVQDYIKW